MPRVRHTQVNPALDTVAGWREVSGFPAGRIKVPSTVLAFLAMSKRTP
jgi:hypothetical protein